QAFERRNQDRDGEHHHRERIHERAEQQVDDHHQEQELDPAEVHRRDQVCESVADSGERHHARKGFNADEQQEDGADGRDGSDGAVQKSTAGTATLALPDQDDADRTQRRDRARFGGGEDAREHSADNDQHQNRNRPYGSKALEPRAPRYAGGRNAVFLGSCSIFGENRDEDDRD